MISIQDKTFDVNSGEEEQKQHENNIYWASWGISLMVTMSNALVRLFSFDKTAITRKLRMNHLKSEGWLFLELAGSYSEFETLQDAFQTFCNNIERIKTEQVEEEYTFNNSFGNPSFGRGDTPAGRNSFVDGQPRRPTSANVQGETMV